jgi:hypothetical protein
MEFHANRAGLYTLPHRGEERNRMVHDRVLPAIRHYHQEVGCVACDVRQSCIEDARGVPA